MDKGVERPHNYGKEPRYGHMFVVFSIGPREIPRHPTAFASKRTTTTQRYHLHSNEIWLNCMPRRCKSKFKIFFLTQRSLWYKNVIWMNMIYIHIYLWIWWSNVWHIEAWRCIYVSEDFVIIGLGNGLAPVWCQGITLTNADLLLTVF